MQRFVLLRLLLVIPMLIGISFVTFLLMELAPGDVVSTQLDGTSQLDARARSQRARQLMVVHGLVDPVTGEKRSLAVRYGRWLRNAIAFRFAGDVAGSQKLRDRILNALPVTLLVNLLALLLAFGVAVPAAARAGMNCGGWFDRLASGGSFVVLGVPEFLLATFFLLLCCGGFFVPFLPSGGLASPGADQLGGFARAWDLVKHLTLPVLSLSLGYGIVVFRFLRDSVARVRESEFVMQLRLFGIDERRVRQRVVRNGLTPVLTLFGGMLPTLVGGTIVIEKIFSLQGLGMLTATAVTARDMPMVMALTMLVSATTLLGLLLADVLQRVVDPRVVLR